MAAISFNDLPQAVSQLCEDMAFIKAHLLDKNPQQQTTTKRPLALQEAAKAVNLPVRTLHELALKGAIPCTQKRGLFYFSEYELTAWKKEAQHA